ncbi:hypothetical protein RZS08_62310, partial [Arthrospira platensis SPKY1]|nr:hypothetical protein [Arthrospira platensis SPKY1]
HDPGRPQQDHRDGKPPVRPRERLNAPDPPITHRQGDQDQPIELIEQQATGEGAQVEHGQQGRHDEPPERRPPPKQHAIAQQRQPEPRRAHRVIHHPDQGAEHGRAA